MALLDLRELAGVEALAYARKSNVDPRNPGKSIIDQTDTTVAGLADIGVNVIECLADDGIGVTRHSKKKVRDGFNRAIEIIEQRPSLRVVGMWALSRATRELKVFGDFLDVCEKHEILLYVGGRFYDPSDWRDRMQLGIEAVVDEADAARIRENTLRGITSSAAAGKPGGVNPYGYYREYDSRTRALIAVHIHPGEAEIIRECARRILNGEKRRSIALDLNLRGVPRPLGGRWNSGEFRGMLLNPTYSGLRTRRGVVVAKAIWPAILEPHEVDELRVIFNETSPARGTHTTTSKYLLTGVVICDRCKDPMYRDTHERGDSYRCNSRRNRSGCNRSRNSAGLEKYVADVVSGWLTDPGFRARYVARSGWEGADELAALERELKDAHTRLGHPDKAVRLSMDAVSALEANVGPRIQRLKLDRDRAGSPILTKPLPKSWPATLEEQNQLLRDLAVVRCLPAKRGRGFDPDSVVIDPAV